MATVSWTDQALADLDAICQFIARDSLRYAELFATRVFAVTETLIEFPLLGRIVPEFKRQDLRELIVQGYRIVYRVKGDELEILTVHHGARLLNEFDGSERS